MAKIDVTVESNKKVYEEEFEAACERILTMLGMEAETAAKKLAPVDTGLLRNSITFAIAGEEANIASYHADRGGETGSYEGSSPQTPGSHSVHIGSNVEYAMAQEVGDFRDGPHAFLRPAINNNTARFKEIIKEELSKTLSGD